MTTPGISAGNIDVIPKQGTIEINIHLSYEIPASLGFHLAARLPEITRQLKAGSNLTVLLGAVYGNSPEKVAEAQMALTEAARDALERM